MPGKPPPLRYAEGGYVWTQTGAVRVRVGFFGSIRLEYQESRIIDTRPPGSGYSPGYYELEVRWVRMRRGESFLLQPPVKPLYPAPTTPPPMTKPK